MTPTHRRRYAVVGTGHRAQMFIDAALGDHADVAELVAWCDTNPGRMDFYDRLLADRGLAPLPQYAPADLETMLAETGAEAAIITSPDDTHAELVSRALRAGVDVVVEKPLTPTEAGCAQVSAAAAETGKNVVMTFNYRYSPRNSVLREVIASGEIGEVTSVHFEWALDTVHGADYFRRWHRDKSHSGGLLVHKSSHHFDLVNWWIGDTPTTVYARGALRVYGDAGAGLAAAGPRPTRGSESDPADPWSLDLNDDPRLAELYLATEHHDGYRRDQDVFAPGITIEDNMAVLVSYARGALLTYSLNAHAPWEGYRVTVNGTRGRAELEVVERGAVAVDADGHVTLDPSAREAADSSPLRPKGQRLIVQTHWNQAREVDIPMGIGSHGGGDAILLADVFNGPGPDPLGRPAGYVDGVRAVAVGIAANASIASGEPVAVADLNLGVDLT